MNIGKVRLWACKEVTGYPDRGIRLTINWGSIGTEYRDPRKNMFIKLHVTALFWSWELHANWKGKVEE